MILCLRTDGSLPELYLYNDESKLIKEFTWQADRKLADELLPTIQQFLSDNDVELADLKGIIVFTGEGSFTGLRIGTTVANTLAYSNGIPIVSSSGKNWITLGLKKLSKAKAGEFITPKYSSEPNITKPKA